MFSSRLLIQLKAVYVQLKAVLIALTIYSVVLMRTGSRLDVQPVSSCPLKLRLAVTYGCV